MISKALKTRLDTLESRLCIDDGAPDGLSVSLWELSEALQGMTTRELDAEAESMGVSAEDVQSIARQYKPRVKRGRR